MPHPTPGARVGALGNRPGAGRAANAGIAARVQDIVGQLEQVNIGPDLFLGPVEQRIDLDQLVGFVPLDGLGIGAVSCLAAADAGYPGFFILQEGAQRLHFADSATLVGLAGPQFGADLFALLLNAQGCGDARKPDAKALLDRKSVV